MKRYSSAFNGISVLDLPSDRLLLNRGVYATYSLKLQPVRAAAPREHTAPNNKKDPTKETEVVIQALQKLMRSEKIQQKPFAEFGLAHPVR